MRPAAVISVVLGLTVASTACTERLILPGGLAGGGSTGEIPGRGGGTGESGGGPAGGGGSSGAGGILGPGGRNGQASGGSNGSSCSGDSSELRFNIKKAKVLLSLSRTVSMMTPFGDGTRISNAQQILRTEVMNNDNAVSFGYQDFPSLAPCLDGSSCCANPDPVDIAANAFIAVNQALMQCESAPPAAGCFGRDRPIVDALRQAQDILGSDRTFDRYVVLIVDGVPSCGGDAGRACADAKAQASAMTLDGIGTYVVTVGEEAEQLDCLQKIAQQGGAPNQNFPFVYSGRDPSQLQQSIHQIVGKAAADACTIQLASALPMGNRLTLSLKGRDVPLDPSNQNGWSFSPGSRDRIEVRGPSCIELQHTQFAQIRLTRCVF